MTDSLVLRESDIEERFVRANGSAAQNRDKDATAVELRVALQTSSLATDVKNRLIAIAGRHVTKAGVLVVVSRALGSQAQNRAAARARLAALLKRAAAAPKTRKRTKPRSADREQRLTWKHRKSALKQDRRGRTTTRRARRDHEEPDHRD
jgi:ribosome-associated protein